MAKNPERKRLRFRGRASDHTFLRLPHYVITSPEWRALGGHAVKFLVELSASFNGRNNGNLSLTRRQALQRGWNSGGTLDRAAQEAVDAGFAVITRHGTAMGRCTLYGITWEPIDDVGNGVEVAPERVPSKRWQKRETQAQNRAGGAP